MIFLKEGGLTKNQYIGRLSEMGGGLEKFADLLGGRACEKKGLTFLRGELIPLCTL